VLGLHAFALEVDGAARGRPDDCLTGSHRDPNAGDFESITGKGVRATVDGRHVLVGNRRLLDESGVDGTPVEDAPWKLVKSADSSR